MGAISTVQSIMDGFDFSYILSIVLGVIPALVCITLHELSHGFVAYKLGDNTAKLQGRLTLNPLKHLDIMGLLMLIVFHFGWAKPVPVNMYKFRNPKRGMALTALAGPVANIIIAFVAFFLYGALLIPFSGSSAGGYVLQMLITTAYMSIGLAVFNIIPIPPLDGSKVLFAFLSDEAHLKLMRYERYGMIVLLLLVSVGVFRQPLSTAVEFLFDKLSVFAQLGFDSVGYIIS